MTRAGRLVLILSSGWLGVSASPATAGLPVEAVPSLRRAVADFDALAQTTRRHDDLPHLADPRAAPVLARIWTDTRVLGQPPYAPDELADLAEIEGIELSVLDQYLNFPAPAPRDLDYDALAIKFQDEIAAALATSVAATAMVGPPTDALLATIDLDRRPTSRQALLMTRQAALALFIHAEKFMSAAPTKGANTLRVATAFATRGADFAAFFPNDDRQILATSLAPTMAHVDPATRAQLAQFVALMSTAPCATMCSTPGR